MSTIYYVKLKGNEVIKFPYDLVDLQNENPYTNYGDRDDFWNIFPETENAKNNGYTLSQVIVSDIPDINWIIQNAKLPEVPTLTNGEWTADWIIFDRTTFPAEPPGYVGVWPPTKIMNNTSGSAPNVIG